MQARQTFHWRRSAGLVAAFCLTLATGCHHAAKPVIPLPPPGSVPNELNKVSLPAYRVEPPDVLLIQAVVAGKADDIPTALRPQPVAGQHQVQVDGTIRLGIYGSLPVAGMTLDEIRVMVQQHLARKLTELNPELPVNPEKLLVLIDVQSYNTKFYYVITDGAGYGEQTASFPITGSDCVLDAITKIGGIPAVGSKRNIWVARRSPHGGPDQILPVDWVGIAQHGIGETNWQLFPGDRVYVKAEPIFRLDGWLQKHLTPVERVIGTTLLGTTAVNSIWGRNFGGNNRGF